MNEKQNVSKSESEHNFSSKLVSAFHQKILSPVKKKTNVRVKTSNYIRKYREPQ